MSKTPEAIKRAFEHCMQLKGCNGCPYSGMRCTVEVSRDALAYIKQLEANQPKWISVYAVLPTRKMKCIVRSKEGRTFTTWYDPEIYRFFPHFAKPNVTHWMPLPEPPKEDK